MGRVKYTCMRSNYFRKLPTYWQPCLAIIELQKVETKDVMPHKIWLLLGNLYCGCSKAERNKKKMMNSAKRESVDLLGGCLFYMFV